MSWAWSLECRGEGMGCACFPLFASCVIGAVPAALPLASIGESRQPPFRCWYLEPPACLPLAPDTLRLACPCSLAPGAPPWLVGASTEDVPRQSSVQILCPFCLTPALTPAAVHRPGALRVAEAEDGFPVVLAMQFMCSPHPRVYASGVVSLLRFSS
jgi:hypothetical protein